MVVVGVAVGVAALVAEHCRVDHQNCPGLVDLHCNSLAVAVAVAVAFAVVAPSFGLAGLLFAVVVWVLPVVVDRNYFGERVVHCYNPRKRCHPASRNFQVFAP